MRASVFLRSSLPKVLGNPRFGNPLRSKKVTRNSQLLRKQGMEEGAGSHQIRMEAVSTVICSEAITIQSIGSYNRLCLSRMIFIKLSNSSQSFRLVHYLLKHQGIKSVHPIQFIKLPFQTSPRMMRQTRKTLEPQAEMQDQCPRPDSMMMTKVACAVRYVSRGV